MTVSIASPPLPDPVADRVADRVATPVLDDDRVGQLTDVFRMMGEPNRLRILLMCRDAPVAVGEIAAELGLSSSLVSHHLRLLRATRLVRAERRGRNIYYLLADRHISNVIADMVDHVGEPSEPSGIGQ